MKRILFFVLFLAGVASAQYPVKLGYNEIAANTVSATFAANTSDTINFSLPPASGIWPSPNTTRFNSSTNLLPARITNTGSIALYVQLTDGDDADSLDIVAFPLDRYGSIVKNDSIDFLTVGTLANTTVDNPGDGQVKRYNLTGEFAPGFFGVAFVFYMRDLAGGARTFRFELACVQ